MICVPIAISQCVAKSIIVDTLRGLHDLIGALAKRNLGALTGGRGDVCFEQCLFYPYLNLSGVGRTLHGRL